MALMNFIDEFNTKIIDTTIIGYQTKHPNDNLWLIVLYTSAHALLLEYSVEADFNIDVAQLETLFIE